MPSSHIIIMPAIQSQLCGHSHMTQVSNDLILICSGLISTVYRNWPGSYHSVKHSNLKCGDLKVDGYGKGNTSKTIGDEIQVENTFPSPSLWKQF